MWTVKKRRLRSADLFIVPGRSCNCSANTNLSMVASISANCELGFWQSSELLWYMRKVVNICDGCHGSHWGHWLWPPSLESLSDALSTVAPSKMLLGWLAMVASSVATMLSSAKTKCMSSRQRVTRYDPLVDTTQPVHIPQWQVWHVPSAQCAFSAFCHSPPHVTCSLLSCGTYTTGSEEMAVIPSFKHPPPTLRSLCPDTKEEKG